MKKNREVIKKLYAGLSSGVKETIDSAVESIVKAKENGGKVVVVTGSGPNLHEGVTTLIAELINKGVIDGVTTSSAVVAHEMAGVLDEVKRVDGTALGFPEEKLPRGNVFEATVMPDDLLETLQKEMIIDNELIDKVMSMPGDVIIKAAGNMAYPMGLRTENLAKEIMLMARAKGKPFEEIAGAGADEDDGLQFIGIAERILQRDGPAHGMAAKDNVFVPAGCVEAPDPVYVPVNGVTGFAGGVSGKIDGL